MSSRQYKPKSTYFLQEHLQKKKQEQQNKKQSKSIDKSSNRGSNKKLEAINNEQIQKIRQTKVQIIKRTYLGHSTKVLKKVSKSGSQKSRDSPNSCGSIKSCGSQQQKKSSPYLKTTEAHKAKVGQLIQQGSSSYKEPILKDIFSYGFIPENKRQKYIPLEKNKSQPDLNNSREQKHIFQHQTRVAINQFHYPFSAIGLLKMIYKQELKNKLVPYIGTAFLIGPKLLMTAAHNIYSHQLESQVVKLYYYPSDKTSKMKDQQFQPYQIKTYYYPPEYKKAIGFDERLKWDYAFVELVEKIGQQYGYFGLDLSNDKQILNQRVYLYGYPFYTEIEPQIRNIECKMYGQTGFIKNVQNNHKILYNISTTGGQSGSPVYHVINESYFVIGIHSQSGQRKQNVNYGYLLREDNLCIKNIQGKLTATKTEIKINPSQQGLPKQLITDTLCKRLPTLLLVKVLTTLDLPYCHIGLQGIKIIVKSNLPELKYLTLNNNSAGKEGAKQLYNGNWPNLCELRFGSNNIEKEGALYLTKGNWKMLKLLYIENNNIGPQGAKFLIEGKWPQLQFLDLQQNNLGFNGANFIKDYHQPNWGKLRLLRIKKNNISTPDYHKITNGPKNIIFD